MERAMTAPKTSAAMALGVLLVLTAALTGCSRTESGPTAPVAPSEIKLAGDFSGSGPGTLKSATKLLTVDRRILKVASIASRITYESTSGIDGRPQLVTGSVFAPIGPPPPNGWPIIAFGHPTTGVQHECGPSLSSSLLGAADAVGTFVKLGFVVTMTDYQGLGLDQTYHPYLDATTGGYNIIDSVRAVRKVVPDTSDQWLALGLSQGGQAAWAANELATAYGAGLHLVGTVSASPAVDITGLADSAATGTLTGEQAAALVWYLEALKNAHPELNLDDYRHGIVREKWDLLAGCQGGTAQERLEVAKQATPADLRPATPAALDTLRMNLSQMSLPKFPALAPMLVLHGDQDRLVNSAWTEAALDRACTMGDVITSYIAIGRGHNDIQPGAALDWIAQRFRGTPPQNTCELQDGPSLRFGEKPWYAE
jgi:acetyl esterase/lipase